MFQEEQRLHASRRLVVIRELVFGIGDAVLPSPGVAHGCVRYDDRVASGYRHQRCSLF